MSEQSFKQKYALQGKIVSILALVVGFIAMYVTLMSGSEAAMWGGIGVMGAACVSTYYFS